MGYPTKLGSQTKDRILEFVRTHAHVSMRTIGDHMETRHGVSYENVKYHVGTMVEQGTLTKVNATSGVAYQVGTTIEETRAAIAALPPRVHDAGPAPAPFREGLTSVEDPVSISWLGRAHGNSIIDRIKNFDQHFTLHDVRFLENLVKTRFPLSEQQEMTHTKVIQDSERTAAITPRASTNGHSNGVLAGRN